MGRRAKGRPWKAALHTWCFVRPIVARGRRWRTRLLRGGGSRGALLVAHGNRAIADLIGLLEQLLLFCWIFLEQRLRAEQQAFIRQGLRVIRLELDRLVDRLQTEA